MSTVRSMCSLVTVTVTEALVLRPLLEDRAHITESICILVPIDRMKQMFSGHDETSLVWENCVCCECDIVDNQSSPFTYAVRDLQPGHAYQLVITAENEAGEGPPSQPSSILIIPEECLYLFVFDFSHIRCYIYILLQTCQWLYSATVLIDWARFNVSPNTL